MLCQIVEGASASDELWSTIDRSTWESAVPHYTTIDFVDLPPWTVVTDQFAAVGAHFVDGNDFILLTTSSLNDGFGLFGQGDNINVHFDEPQSWMAIDFPGVLCISFFDGNRLLCSADVGIGGGGNFTGFRMPPGVTFDALEFDDPRSVGAVHIDDIHFGRPSPGDVNQDGVVNVDDLVVVLLNWGACPLSESCPSDMNADGVVDVDDLLEVIVNWTTDP